MKANLFKTASVFLLVLLAGVTAAQAKDGRRNHPGRPEVKAYFQQNILPVVRHQRQKLEAQLSADDKAQLATYRTQLRDLHQRGKALRQSIRPEGRKETGRPNLTEAQQQQIQQLRSDARGIMLNVAQMARKYEANISQLTREVQPQKAKWTADIQAIVAKTSTPEQQGQTRHLKQRHHGSRPHSGMRGGFFRPARFLLMDPNAPVKADEVDANGSSVFPNPASAANQLEYSVKKAGPVTIELLDSRGNTLRALLQNEQQEKGTHTIYTPLGDLPRGTYFYKITSKSGSETKRFVKE
ncbi:T9SS type A sorting domain-containing protein [Hymenobacter sp. BT175]|uniref:T9SS type A sorting domain-containing protein n=1 Tax=Hymenobacter translucens TaxID=2886507 RepID=UPI001D0E2B8A|nr:T9SS type A sorting domain-containing protein [Hymenobacter translucens]MCC2548129.1 T9SS type A sorting domain-containing protein [Hymenobacter translucens]